MRPPKMSRVSRSQLREAATAMMALGCMWSTCRPGRKLCRGVSMDDARGLRLNVAWAYIATMSSSALDFRPLSFRAP